MANTTTTLNINNSDDPFYRYKMPALQAKQQTNCVVIENLSGIASSLNRPACMILKFFGVRLGTQVNTSKNTINGTFKASDLQDTLQEFIATYVLCPSCGNPETTIYMKKTTYKRSCKACGIDERMQETKILKYAVLVPCKK